MASIRRHFLLVGPPFYEAVRWLPVLAAGVYVATVAVMFRGLVRALYWDTDAAGALVLADRLRGHGAVSIPHFGWWTSLWWLLATRHLPGHVPLWKGTGYVFALAAAGLVGWATARVAGKWAGATAASATLVVGPDALKALLTVNFHVSTPFTAAALAAYLVLLGRNSSWLLAATVGIVAGMNAASDPLLWIAGIAPFAIAAAVLGASSRRRDVFARAAITLALTVTSALATSALMHRLGFGIVSADIRPAHLSDLVLNAEKLGRFTALVGGANYVLPGAYPSEPLRALVALIALIGVAAALVSPVRKITRGAAPLTRAYACYWATAIALLGISFVASSEGTIAGEGGYLYLLTLAPAAAAGACLLAAGSRRGQLAVALAVAVIGGINVAGLAQGRADTPKGAIGTFEPALVRLLEREGVTRGYAGYWDAHNLTWQSRERLFVVPVADCASARGPRLCPYRFFTIASWYTERPAPSFLIVDPETGFITKPPPFARDAFASFRLGPLSVYLFRYDIARRLGRPVS